MLVYHSTDHQSRAGIEANGFVAGVYGPFAWFCERLPEDGFVPTSRRDWWVVVDLGDDVDLDDWQQVFEDGSIQGGKPGDRYLLIPIDVVNAQQPFTYMRWSREPT